MPISWNQVASGARIDLRNPKPEEIHLDDLLQGVAGIWRFNNHLTKQPYSVLMHTINMEWFAKSRGESFAIREQILFHDLHESYIGDLTTSLKNAVPQFRGVDVIMQRAVFLRFGVVHPLGEIVKEIDQKAARWEAEQGFDFIRDDWTKRDLPELSIDETRIFNRGSILAKQHPEALKKIWHAAWKDVRPCE